MHKITFILVSTLKINIILITFIIKQNTGLDQNVSRDSFLLKKKLSYILNAYNVLNHNSKLSLYVNKIMGKLICLNY